MHEFNFLYPDYSNLVEKAKYTWDSGWIWLYESPWGIIEKFKLANSAQDKDVLELLGTDSVRNKIKKFYSYRDRDLVSLAGFDEIRLVQILGVNIKELNRNQVDAIIAAMPNFDNNDLYFNKNLNICPECIKYSYHSIFHQIAFISECPFHGYRLISECPECKRNIAYQLSDKYTSSPFVCLCGYSYINIDMFREYMKTWNRVPDIKIVSNKINLWLNVNKDYAGKLNHSFFFKDIAKCHFNNIIDYNMSILDVAYDTKSNINHVTISYCLQDFYAKKKDIQQPVESFQAEANRVYITIFRSIARYIRRKLLNKHKSCVKSLTRRSYLENFDNIPICQHAFAYVMWRKEIEGYRKYSDVQNKVRPKLNYKRAKIGRHIICYSDELQELIYGWIKYPKTASIDVYNMFIWIISRTIGFLLYHRFINYLKIAEKSIKAGFIAVDIGEISSKLPYFIFLYPSEQDKTCKMHYWLEENDDIFKISAYQMCPKKTKSKSRRHENNQAFPDKNDFIKLRPE